MAYVVTRFGIPFLSTFHFSVPSGQSHRLVDAAARLDRLSAIDRREILESRLWQSLRPEQRPDYGSRLFAALRPKVVPRWNGGDVEKEIVWLVAGGDDSNGDDSRDSIPSVLRVPASRLLGPPVAPPPESNTMTHLQALPGGLELARKYALRILQAFGDGEAVSEMAVRRAEQFLQIYRALAETEQMGSLEEERTPQPKDTLDRDLKSGVELFSMDDLFGTFDSASSSGGKRVVRLSAFFASRLQEVRRDTFSPMILDLARAEELREEPVLREYLLKVAVIHLMRFSEIEDSERRRLRTEIFFELGESSSRSVQIDSISDEVLSILSWMLTFYADHPVLPFFKRAGSSGEGELIGVSGMIQFSDEILNLMMGDGTVVPTPPKLEARYPEVADLQEIPGGLSFFLPDPRSGKLKPVDLGFGRAWDFKTGGMGTLSLVERVRHLQKTDPLDPLLLVAKRIRTDKRQSERQTEEAMERFLKEAAIGEILGGNPHILSVTQVAWLGEGDPVAIMRYLLPWGAKQDEVDVPVNTLHDLIHSRIPYDFSLVLERMLLPVAQALVFAHTKEVVHYDVKPRNLFVEKREGETDPRAVLADWGMAEILRENQRRSGSLCGTPGYFFRRDLHGTIRDVRAFGIMAYEAVARRHPVRTTRDYAHDEVGEGLLTLAPWEDQVRPVRDFFPGIPTELEGWIYRTMGYSKSEQVEQFGLDVDEAMKPYTSMQDVLKGLEQFIALDKARQSVGDYLENIRKSKESLLDPKRFPHLKMTRAEFDSFRVQALTVHAEYEHVLSRLGNIDPKMIREHQDLLWRLYEEAEVFGLEMEIRPLLSRYDALVTQTMETGGLSIFPVGVKADAVRVDLVQAKLGDDNSFHELLLWSDRSLVGLDLRLPKGVYYLRLRAEGYVPMQLPVTVRRGVLCDTPVPFYKEAAIPEGFAVIPGGKVVVEEYPDSYWMQTDRVEKVRPFAVSRTMVTNAQYIEFLNALIQEGKKEEALRRVPRNSGGIPLWHSAILERMRRGETLDALPSFEDDQKPILDQGPVIWISNADAKAWINWRYKGKPFFRLPTTTEILLLMRGLDARKRPWGDRIQFPGASHVKPVSWERESVMGIDIVNVGQYPLDVSPMSHPEKKVFDVFGLARKMTSSVVEQDGVAYSISMGAGYSVTGDGSLATFDPYFGNIAYSHGFFVVCELPEI